MIELKSFLEKAGFKVNFYIFNTYHHHSWIDEDIQKINYCIKISW